MRKAGHVSRMEETGKVALQLENLKEVERPPAKPKGDRITLKEIKVREM
jgi:hypothetical protein